MKKYENGIKNKSLLSLVITSSLIEIFVTLVAIFVFAAVMLFCELPAEYSTIFATASVALGSFLAAFYAAKKLSKRGFAVGLIVGGITFIIVTLISIFTDKGSFTSNTLFHLIIIMLASLIGGIMGVNKGLNKKYI